MTTRWPKCLLPIILERFLLPALLLLAASEAHAQSLSINTSSFPIGNVTVPFQATLSAQGGTGGYEWKIIAGKLPTGLALAPSTGVIQGTPTAIGSAPLTFQVTDSSGDTATLALTLTIDSLPLTPQLPSAWVNTVYPNTSKYTVVHVPARADLQAAINNASCSPTGTVLLLASGATFEKNYTLPVKTCASNQWIIISTDTASGNLPAPNQRIDPSYSPVLAKIVTPNSSPAILAQNQPNHYWLMGLEIAVDPAVSMNYVVIQIGNKENTSGNLPHHIYVDRCYIHGTPTGEDIRGFQANGKFLAAINSYFQDFHSTAYDAQAIAAWNTTGPVKIVNNFLEGSGENVIFGGADPLIKNAIPSDLEIRLNHFYKPLTWKPDDPSYQGIKWAVKNLLELKNAQRVLVEGDILEHNWAEAQDGFGVLFTPRNQNGNCPWCAVANVTFRYNIFQHSGCGFNISGEDNDNPSLPAAYLSIHDNLMVDINGPAWGGAAGKLYQLVDGPNGATLIPPHDINVDHNTAFQSGDVLVVGSEQNLPITNFTFINNIEPHNQYGIIGTGTGIGNATLEAYFSSPVVTANVLEALPSGVTPSQYPAGNFFPPDWTTVQFVNYDGGDFRLEPTSPYHDAGTDGLDLGGNIGAVDSITVGVAQPNPEYPQ